VNEKVKTIHQKHANKRMFLCAFIGVDMLRVNTKSTAFILQTRQIFAQFAESENKE
jgi:hypothetical protein